MVRDCQYFYDEFDLQAPNLQQKWLATSCEYKFDLSIQMNDSLILSCSSHYINHIIAGIGVAK